MFLIVSLSWWCVLSCAVAAAAEQTTFSVHLWLWHQSQKAGPHSSATADPKYSSRSHMRRTRLTWKYSSHMGFSHAQYSSHLNLLPSLAHAELMALSTGNLSNNVTFAIAYSLDSLKRDYLHTCSEAKGRDSKLTWSLPLRDMWWRTSRWKGHMHVIPSLAETWPCRNFNRMRRWRED